MFTVQYTFGGGGENRTPVQNTFGSTSYDHKIKITIKPQIIEAEIIIFDQ